MTCKKFGIIVLSMLLLLLAACQSSQTKQLNDIFVEKLDIDAGTIKNYDTEIQDVNVSKHYDDVSFHITQTFGDEKFLYIILDVVFEDAQMFQKFASEENTSSLNILVSDKKETDFHAPTDPKTYNTPFNLNIRNWAANYEKNQMTYLITLQTNTTFQTITLYIPNITADLNGSGEETLAPGPYLISWDVNNTGKFYVGEIQDTDIVGNVLVSPFGLIVDLSRSPYESWEELRESITISQNKAPFPLTGHLSGGVTPSTGETHLIFTFSELLNLDKLDSLQIGDQSITLTEWNPTVE